MKFHDTFWRHAESLDTFFKRFWDLGAVLNRHQVANKTTGHKTQKSVEEINFGEKFRKGETKAQQTRNWQPGKGELVSWVSMSDLKSYPGS